MSVNLYAYNRRLFYILRYNVAAEVLHDSLLYVGDAPLTAHGIFRTFDECSTAVVCVDPVAELHPLLSNTPSRFSL